MIQFKTATSLGSGVYRLSGLLRGRLGTESAISMHAAGERFLLLDEAVIAMSIPTSHAGSSWTLRAVSNGDALSNGEQSTIVISGQSLKPFTPVHVRAIRQPSNAIALQWVRRARIEGGWRDFIEIPLLEESEVYDVAIMSGSLVLRSWRVTTPNLSYSAADQVADYGSLPTAINVRISQISALIGPGEALNSSVTVE
jgi:hypothetical protein